MKAPACPFYPDSCTVSHHGPREPHQWKGVANKVANRVANIPAAADTVANIANTVARKAAAVKKRAGDRDAYNARQREYMRKRRAKT